MDQWTIAPRRGEPVIATGHQAWLWHPGILAKDIAMAVAAERLTPPVRMLHLVVDHDVHETLYLTLPVREGDRLRTQRVQLAPVDATIPTGCQPPADPRKITAALDALAARPDVPVDLGPLRDAAAALDDGPKSLAEQVAAMTAHLMRPYVGEVQLMYSSRLMAQIDAQAMVQRMLGDARACAAAYNRAAAEFPQAGIGTLSVEPERVELPLWQLTWGRPRRRVYADLAVPDDPILTLEDGTPIGEDARWLAPKALLLTAIMRRHFCDLFIHGTGGGLYDRVMEAWWREWTGEGADAFAARAVVTADLFLGFDAPVADRAELARAQWYRHHLPHNVDRVLPPGAVNGPLVAEKRALLAHMDDDRDADRRWAAFRRLHAINDELVAQHPEALADADERLRRARIGIANAAVARKRDWCFALYPPEDLMRLRENIEQRTQAASPRR